MRNDIIIRPIEREDHAQWRSLWDGYNAFYGREGETALAENITHATWVRFFSDQEPVLAFVATEGDTMVALVHCLFHRSTTRTAPQTLLLKNGSIN